MAEFRNPDNGVLINIDTFYTTFSNGEIIYKDKNKKQLVNESGKPLIYVKKEKDIKDLPTIISFESKTPLEKQKIFRERANSDFKKNGEEVKRQMQKDSLDSLKNLVKK